VEANSTTNLVPFGWDITELRLCENCDLDVPVNILTPFVHAPFSWATQHTTMCLDPHTNFQLLSSSDFPSRHNSVLVLFIVNIHLLLSHCCSYYQLNFVPKCTLNSFPLVPNLRQMDYEFDRFCKCEEKTKETKKIASWKLSQHNLPHMIRSLLYLHCKFGLVV